MKKTKRSSRIRMQPLPDSTLPAAAGGMLGMLSCPGDCKTLTITINKEHSKLTITATPVRSKLLG